MKCCSLIFAVHVCLLSSLGLAESNTWGKKARLNFTTAGTQVAVISDNIDRLAIHLKQPWSKRTYKVRILIIVVKTTTILNLRRGVA